MTSRYRYMPCVVIETAVRRAELAGFDLVRAGDPTGLDAQWRARVVRADLADAYGSGGSSSYPGSRSNVKCTTKGGPSYVGYGADAVARWMHSVSVARSL